MAAAAVVYKKTGSIFLEVSKTSVREKRTYETGVCKGVIENYQQEMIKMLCNGEPLGIRFL